LIPWNIRLLDVVSADFHRIGAGFDSMPTDRVKTLLAGRGR